MQSGKTSIVERLKTVEFGAIANKMHYGNGCDTRESRWHKLDIEHVNDFYVIDTPGLGDRTEGGPLRGLQGIEVAAQIAGRLNADLFRLYFVVDPARRNALEFSQNLRLIWDVFGEDAARSLRLIVNKSDLLADQGEQRIRESFIPMLEEVFISVFGSRPDKILFICARYLCNTGCIGQLLDDLCEGSNPILLPQMASQYEYSKQIQEEVRASQHILEQAQALHRDAQRTLNGGEAHLTTLQDELATLQFVLGRHVNSRTIKEQQVVGALQAITDQQAFCENLRHQVNALNWPGLNLHIDANSFNYHAVIAHVEKLYKLAESNYQTGLFAHGIGGNPNAVFDAHTDQLESDWNDFQVNKEPYLNKLNLYNAARQSLTEKELDHRNRNSELNDLIHLCDQFQNSIEQQDHEITSQRALNVDLDMKLTQATEMQALAEHTVFELLNELKTFQNLAA